MLRLLVLSGLLLAASAASSAQIGPAVPDEVVTWTATVAPPRTAAEWTDTFAPGEQAYVTVTARVRPGWRVYALDSPGGLPLQFHLDALPDGLAPEGAVGHTPPRDAYDPVLEEAYRYYAGEARLWQAVRLAPGLADGPREVTGAIRFAACNDEVCLPPREVPFRARLTVRAASAP